MTPAERLRAAAARIREVASNATPGKWETYGSWPFEVFSSGNDEDGLDDAQLLVAGSDGIAGNSQHASLWSPPVALAVADWLDNEALIAYDLTRSNTTTRAWVAVGPGFTLAELILGGAL